MSFLLIFLGSGLGGLFRFLVSVGIHKFTNISQFPVGTFVVNILGCFLIGLLTNLLDVKGFATYHKHFFLIGLLGGFTTFSTFNFETVSLITDGQYMYALTNATLQVVFGIIAVWLGILVVRFV